MRACADAQAGCARAAAPRARANENGVPALVPARPAHPLPLASPTSRNGLALGVMPDRSSEHRTNAPKIWKNRHAGGLEVVVSGRVPLHTHISGASLGPPPSSAFAVRGARSTSQYDSAPPRLASSDLAQSARRTILRCAARRAQNVLPPNIRARAALACEVIPTASQARPSGFTCGSPFPARSALAPSIVPSSAAMLPSRDFGQSTFLANDGLGNLSATDWTLQGKVVSAASADLNSDGWPDLAVAQRDRVELYLSSRAPRPNAAERNEDARLRQAAAERECAAQPQPPGTTVASPPAAGLSSSQMEPQRPLSPGSLIPGATLAAKLQATGYAMTTWAGGLTYYLPPGVAVRQMSASVMAATGGAWLFPAPDVTGTPRVWVNTVGQVVSKSFTGPYGEELGLFSEPNFSGVTFAGYVHDMMPASLYYTPNRYLGGQGRFLSVDPSDQLNTRDPRSFNQYVYVAGNPLTFRDQAGLGWGSDFADWVDRKVDQTMDAIANSNADPGTYFQAENTAEVVKMAADTARMGEGTFEVYEAAQRGDYLGVTRAVIQETGRVSNVLLVAGVAGKVLQAASKGTRFAETLNTPLSQLGKGAGATGEEVNAAYEAARAGGRHAGTLRNYAGRSTGEIQRAIASYERQAALHGEKIANPARYAEHWGQMTPQEQAGLIRYWQKEASRYKELADVLRGLLGGQ